MHALEIDGWMTPAELKWLALQASIAEVIIEIGVWQGRSTAALAAHTAGVVFAVDHFLGSPAEFRTLPANQQNPLSLRALALANLSPYSAAGKLFLLEEHSSRAYEFLRVLLRWRLADMVFIDGSHVEQEVWDDLQHYRRLLRHGGLLCGHDRSALGVRNALAAVGIGYQCGPGDLWYAYEA